MFSFRGWNRNKEPELTAGQELYLQKLQRHLEIQSPYVDTNIADELKTSVRILCLILTTEARLKTRAKTVNTTWARRCNSHYFVANTDSTSQDIIHTDYEEKRQNVVYKVEFAMKYIYDNKINNFDWLLKADDDTYVIVENLRFLLQQYDRNKPGYIGFHFDKFVSNGFMSGGAGYVISNSALRHLVKFGFNHNACPVFQNVDDPENSEDIEVGRCLNVTGVPILSSLDSSGRETFHPYAVDKYIDGLIPQYVFEWAKNEQRYGPECCSQMSISYHYMDPGAMLLAEHLLYQTSIYGRNTKRTLSVT